MKFLGIDITEAFNTLFYGAIAALIGGVIYLLRTVFSNKRALDKLQCEIDAREESSKKRDAKIDRLVETLADVKERLARIEGKMEK